MKRWIIGWEYWLAWISAAGAVEVPMAGRPADFSGAIGQFRLRATATPLSLQVGESVRYRLEVSGRGDISKAHPPDLERQAAFAESFGQIEPPQAEDTPQGKLFTYRLLVRAAADRIPPARLSYYNPQTGRFELAVANPISLHVTAPPMVGADDWIAPVPVAAAAAEPARKEWLALALTVSAAALAAGSITWWRRRPGSAPSLPSLAPEPVRAQPELGETLRPPPALDPLPSDPERLRALAFEATAALSERVRLRPGERTAADFARRLRQMALPAEIAESWSLALSAFERLRFDRRERGAATFDWCTFFAAYRGVAEAVEKTAEKSAFGSAADVRNDGLTELDG